LKISQAAEALNNAEMGLGESQENDKSIMSISSDQLYVNDDKVTDRVTPNNTNEAAAITIAKEAASNYLKDHPD
jgi:hypothetical protein